jgi:hypothetical protein
MVAVFGRKKIRIAEPLVAAVSKTSMIWWFSCKNQQRTVGLWVDFFSNILKRTVVIYQRWFADLLKPAVMNPKNHPDNRWGSVPVWDNCPTLFITL